MGEEVGSEALSTHVNTTDAGEDLRVAFFWPVSIYIDAGDLPLLVMLLRVSIKMGTDVLSLMAPG